jgi:hypothetical protein
MTRVLDLAYAHIRASKIVRGLRQVVTERERRAVGQKTASGNECAYIASGHIRGERPLHPNMIFGS